MAVNKRMEKDRLRIKTNRFQIQLQAKIKEKKKRLRIMWNVIDFIRNHSTLEDNIVESYCYSFDLDGFHMDFDETRHELKELEKKIL